MPLNGASKKMPSQARLSAPIPKRRTSAEATSPTLQPMTKRLAKKASRGGPRENTQTSKRGSASSAAGPTLINVRMKLMTASAATSSYGLSGLTKICPRLRDHISSRNDSEMPRLARNSTSHSSTALISTPAASATHELCWRKKSVMKPHRKSCTSGQYMSSRRRGHEPRRT